MDISSTPKVILIIKIIYKVWKNIKKKENMNHCSVTIKGLSIEGKYSRNPFGLRSLWVVMP